MRPAVLEFLACPACAAELSPTSRTTSSGEILSGSLRCQGCPRAFPIHDGVPDLRLDSGGTAVEQTTDGFHRNWDAYNDVIVSHQSLNDELFRDWIQPLEPATFDGKVVLEAGCGMGRWLSVAASYSPRALIGLDYSGVAHTAYRNTHRLPRLHVVRGDIFHLPLKPTIDVIYSIGVVHHTPDPALAFRALVDKLAPDGSLSVWVYGEENNDWISKYVTPLRERLTSRMPHGALQILSKALTLQLVLMAEVQERFAPGVAWSYAEYLRYLRRYPRRYLEHIVYDHLAPQIAYYISEDELRRWARDSQLVYRLSARNGNSWRILAARTEEALRRGIPDGA